MNCRTCGACCSGGLDDSDGYADVTLVDVARLKPSTRRRLVPMRYGWEYNDGAFATPSKFDEQWGKCCAFLRGTPGRRVSCRIYEDRPTICRKFRPGSRACKDARAQIGLSNA